jgi:hypothetical protein
MSLDDGEGVGAYVLDCTNAVMNSTFTRLTDINSSRPVGGIIALAGGTGTQGLIASNVTFTDNNIKPSNLVMLNTNASMCAAPIPLRECTPHP